METIRILLVDDHQVVRQGLRSLLELEPGLQVVGEAGAGAEALNLIDRVHPDIVLLDLKLTDISGTEVCRRATAQYPGIAILILTAISNGQEVLECVDAGAKGYLLKDVDVYELTRTIRAIHRGESVLDPKVTQAVLQRARRASKEAAPALTLTDQELGIVRLIAQGLTNKEIGERLFLSPNTIKFHISDIMQKLKVKRRAEVVFKAAGERLI
ncbi:MAG: response regulator transcription factor [Chloroflexi bacterium]|nr:response regulator transcription factor [Chloroflexota bacterium]